MSKLYRIIGYDKIEYIPQEFSLFELLIDNKTSYVTGIKFIGNTKTEITSFHSFNYIALVKKIFNNLISDKEQNLIGNILVPEKQIHILPYYNKRNRPHYNYFYDAGKADGNNTFYYDGTFRDALLEFQKEGFIFHRAEQKLNKPIITEENISIENIK